MILEMALADAYGIAFEFVDEPQFINDLKDFHQHPTYDDMKPGSFTDDTHRSIANAQVILDRDPYNPMDYIKAYQEIFLIDPRPGYSRRYEAFLRDHVHCTPKDFSRAINRKITNGSVMGVSVLGFLNDPKDVAFAAIAQAISTHDPRTAFDAQIIALTAHYFIHGMGPSDDIVLCEFLASTLDLSTKDRLSLMDRLLAPSKKATMTAKSVADLLLSRINKPPYSLAELTKFAVGLGGDTDSAAAVLVAVASHNKAYEHDLPLTLFEKLEPREYGNLALYHREHLISLDRKLREKFLETTPFQRAYWKWRDDISVLSSPDAMIKECNLGPVSSEDIKWLIDEMKSGVISIATPVLLAEVFGNQIGYARMNVAQTCQAWIDWHQGYENEIDTIRKGIAP